MKLLSRPTSFNTGLGLFLFTSVHFILFFTKSHGVLYFLFRFFYIKYVINVNTLCTTFNAEPNRYVDLKKMMYRHRQEQCISLTSFVSWFKLDRKCNLAAGFCAVHNNPTVAKTWTPNRLGKTIWSYYWHFLSNVKNTRKPLVKPATGWGRRKHVASGRQHEANVLEYNARCTILTAFYEDEICTNLDKLLKGKHR